MQALEYRPDMAARSMRTGTTRAVGFVVIGHHEPGLLGDRKGRRHRAHPNGYSLVLANSMSDGERESEAIAALRQRRVDGLIAAVADEDAPGLADRLRRFRPAFSSTARCRVDRRRRLLGARYGDGAGAPASRRSGPPPGRSGRGLGASARQPRPHRGVPAASHRARSRRRRELVVTGELIPRDRLRHGRAARARGPADRPDRRQQPAHRRRHWKLCATSGCAVPTDLSLVACDDTELTRMHDPPIDVIDRDPEQHGRDRRAAPAPASRTRPPLPAGPASDDVHPAGAPAPPGRRRRAAR